MAKSLAEVRVRFLHFLQCLTMSVKEELIFCRIRYLVSEQVEIQLQRRTGACLSQLPAVFLLELSEFAIVRRCLQVMFEH